MGGSQSITVDLGAVLAAAVAQPQETAAVVGFLAVVGWMKLSKPTRRRIRRWAWRGVTQVSKWAWRHATAGRRCPSPAVPDRWPVVPGGPTVLYRHFDAAGQLLYVGITAEARGGRRWEEHEADKPWFHLVAHTTVSAPYPSRALALYAEAVAIRDENPLHNICRPDPARIGLG
jgi:hypothetical protein